MLDQEVGLAKEVKQLEQDGNAEIPADIRQNEKIRVLEKEVERLRNEQGN